MCLQFGHCILYWMKPLKPVAIRSVACTFLLAKFLQFHDVFSIKTMLIGCKFFVETLSRVRPSKKEIKTEEPDNALLFSFFITLLVYLTCNGLVGSWFFRRRSPLLSPYGRQTNT